MEQKKAIQLTQDEIRTGQIISDRGKKHFAAYEAMRDTEAEYMQQLREKYGCGPEYLVLDWNKGLTSDETVEEVIESDSEVLSVKDN